MTKIGIGSSVPRVEDTRFLTSAGCYSDDVAAPAVMNALLDALAPLGVRNVDMPATPERVWRAIRDAPQP